ncbi:MAG TPA: hypothetical protein VMA35_06755 [Candidatus Sulfopaludibacter sp.]|nr:hypothetical protein [Candidatus Sulfopaludibacter sp.]
MNSKLPLNEPQERRLTIVLTRVEGALRNLRANVLHPPESSRLTCYVDPIDPTLAEPLANAIGRAQIQVERMARDLDLHAGRNSICHTHLAAFELLNIDLYTSRVDGLRGYGKIASPTAHYLETEIAALETDLEAIIRWLKSNETGT